MWRFATAATATTTTTATTTAAAAATAATAQFIKHIHSCKTQIGVLLTVCAELFHEIKMAASRIHMNQSVSLTSGGKWW